MTLFLLGFYLGVAACVFCALYIADRASGNGPHTPSRLLACATWALLWPVIPFL